VEQTQFIKGSLTAIILKLLENNSRMYGYEMTKAVKEITGNKVNITEAALYPALHRLVEDELLETTVEQVGGRMRKYYSLTKKGKKESVIQIDSMLDALASVQLLLNKKLLHG
jgi:PadR family transcriptional regulator PadR